jgi:hypothetical protein
MLRRLRSVDLTHDLTLIHLFRQLAGSMELVSIFGYWCHFRTTVLCAVSLVIEPLFSCALLAETPRSILITTMTPPGRQCIEKFALSF